MFLRGRTMFDPCLGDADTHASHMCQSPYHAGRRRRRPLQHKIQVYPTDKLKIWHFYSVSVQTRHTLPRLGDANTHASHMC